MLQENRLTAEDLMKKIDVFAEEAAALITELIDDSN